MSKVGLKLSRVEGGMYLVQEDSGTIRLAVPPPRGVERLLAGRFPQDAVFLTQQISADSAISHAIAAVTAWETAGEVSVAHNGLLVRDLLHTLSILHANLRNFYFQILPDYIPPGAIADYKGGSAQVRALAESLKGKEADSWARFRFPHGFAEAELTRLVENRGRAEKALSRLQRMMAMLGGKFPMVMSIVPGGVTLPVSESLVLRLRDYLREFAGFVREAPLQDGLLLVETDDSLKGLGRGGEAMISAGTIGDEAGPAASLFPRGVWMARKLEPLQPRIRENLLGSFYRVSVDSQGRNGALEPAPDKPGAYSWIKAPRYLDRAMETGALARLVITHRSGSRSYTVAVVEQIESLLQTTLGQANTVGGRMIARLGELVPLLHRCETLLAQFTPGQPSVNPPGDLASLTAEAAGRIEAPAGMLQHRIVFEKGRVAHADVISPSTWNGAPRSEKSERSGLELALNGAGLDLRVHASQLLASRIVHSYFFSASDAVQ